MILFLNYIIAYIKKITAQKVDCIYNFNEFGGKQCWGCPLVKDCVEQSNKNE